MDMRHRQNILHFHCIQRKKHVHKDITSFIVSMLKVTHCIILCNYLKFFFLRRKLCLV